MNALAEALTEVYRRCVGPGMTASMAAQSASRSQFEDVASLPPEEPAQDRSVWLWAVVAVALFAGAIGGVFALRGRSGDDGAVGPSASGSLVPVVAHPVATKDSVDEPKPAKQAATVAVLIESHPAHAEVFRAGERLGKAALNVQVTLGEPTRLTMRLPGYREQLVEVDGRDDKVTVTLEKAPSVRPASALSPPRAKRPRKTMPSRSGDDELE